MKIVWTKKGSESFNGIVEYIEKEFSQKEVDFFILEVYGVISHITSYPKMYPVSRKNKKIRKATITKQCCLLYKINRSTITLLLFWDNRKDPNTIKIS